MSKEDIDGLKAGFLPFSTGAMNCAGKNLAMLELLAATARTLYRMDMRSVPGNTLGECGSHMGWGQRNRMDFEFTGDYLAVDRKGPVVQFRTRQD